MPRQSRNDPSFPPGEREHAGVIASRAARQRELPIDRHTDRGKSPVVEGEKCEIGAVAVAHGQHEPWDRFRCQGCVHVFPTQKEVGMRIGDIKFPPAGFQFFNLVET